MSERMRQGLKALTLVAVAVIAFVILAGFDPGDGARDLPQAQAASASAGATATVAAATPAVEATAEAEDEDAGPSSFEELQQMIDEDPTNADLWRDLGQNLVTSHEYVGAAEAFAAAVDLRPGDARLHSDLATALLYQGLVRVARDEYERALAIDPELPEAHFNLGITYSHSAPMDIDRALEAWRLAIKFSDNAELTSLAEQYIQAYASGASQTGGPEVEAGTGSVATEQVVPPAADGEVGGGDAND